jgi:hypothetical protein
MKKKNLTYTVFLSIMLVAFLALLALGSFWIHDSKLKAKSESIKIREIQMNYMKAELSSKVNAMIEYTNYGKQQTEIT